MGGSPSWSWPTGSRPCGMPTRSSSWMAATSQRPAHLMSCAPGTRHSPVWSSSARRADRSARARADTWSYASWTRHLGRRAALRSGRDDRFAGRLRRLRPSGRSRSSWSMTARPSPSRSALGSSSCGARRMAASGPPSTGAERASGDLLLILNSDVEIESDFIQRLSEAAEPWLPAVCGPLLRDGLLRLRNHWAALPHCPRSGCRMALRPRPASGITGSCTRPSGATPAADPAPP